MEDLTKFIEDGHPIDIVYLDFKKAFDSVPHQRLPSKLAAYGITGNILKWIKDFLTNRHQRVRVGNHYSPMTEVLSGIPQGSVLGPILFTIFINDLPDCVQSCCKVFADDTKIYVSADNAGRIPEELIRLQKWSDLWNLYFNVTKCKILHIVIGHW